MAQQGGNTPGMQTTGSAASTAARGSMGAQGDTGVQDSTFNVISVVYHALQGAETIQKYLQDVKGGDRDVEEFLREAQEQNKRIAQRGRECLQQMLHQGGGSGQQMQSGRASGQMGGATGGGKQSPSGGA